MNIEKNLSPLLSSVCSQSSTIARNTQACQDAIWTVHSIPVYRLCSMSHFGIPRMLFLPILRLTHSSIQDLQYSYLSKMKSHLSLMRVHSTSNRTRDDVVIQSEYPWWSSSLDSYFLMDPSLACHLDSRTHRAIFLHQSAAHLSQESHCDDLTDSLSRIYWDNPPCWDTQMFHWGYLFADRWHSKWASPRKNSSRSRSMK